MYTNLLRPAVVAAVATPLLLLGSGTSNADAATATPDPIRPVVLIGQKTDPLGALLACAPAGILPVFGPNIIFPICVA